MKTIQRISILGSGGHAKVVVDALLTCFPDSQISLYDGSPEKEGTSFMGHFKILSENSLDKDHLLHVAIGDNEKRMALIQKYRPTFENLMTVQHSSAVVSMSAVIGNGCFIAASAILGPDTMIGHGVIINHDAIVDHDCSIDSGSHIAPNATLGGGVIIGSNVLVGAGAVILRGLTIGHNVIIGAGAVVTKNVPSDEMVLGIPARRR